MPLFETAMNWLYVIIWVCIILLNYLLTIVLVSLPAKKKFNEFSLGKSVRRYIKFEVNCFAFHLIHANHLRNERFFLCTLKHTLIASFRSVCFPFDLGFILKLELFSPPHIHLWFLFFCCECMWTRSVYWLQDATKDFKMENRFKVRGLEQLTCRIVDYFTLKAKDQIYLLYQQY